MGWVVKLGGVIAGAAAIWALAAAGRPSALSQTRGGLWEVDGAPGSAKPIRQCIPDTRVLAQFEHRGKGCPRTVITDAGTNATIEYNCGSSGFGSSRDRWCRLRGRRRRRARRGDFARKLLLALGSPRKTQAEPDQHAREQEDEDDDDGGVHAGKATR